jgi:hypothetical protein
MASSKVEVVAEPEAQERELYPGVTLKWTSEVNITEEKLDLFKNLLEMLFRENPEDQDDSGLTADE